jgi:hypothetical protein
MRSDILHLILRVLDYTVTISCGCILYFGCFNLFCNAWVCVCVGFVMCGCFGNMCTCIYCVLYCFVYIYIVICFSCTIVKTTATE